MEQDILMDKVLAIENKLALKELVDTFSLVSDQKDNVAQASFFTEDGILTSIMRGNTLTFNGRKEIEDGFAAILTSLDTVYHLNGQHLATIDGESATGYCYCLATLIGKENGKAYCRTIYANYQDEYVKDMGEWFIAKRTATVAWEQKTEINH